VLLHTVTMDAGQGVDLLRRVDPGCAVPAHHDDYGVFRSRLPEFISLAQRRGLGHLIRPVERGETVSLRPAARPDRHASSC